MSLRIRIAAKADLTKLPKNIVLSGKGVNRVNLANGELYDRCPIENYHHQNVAPSSVDAANEDSVDVFVGSAGSEKPEMDLSGVWQVVLVGASPLVEVSDESVNLWHLQKVETVRNETT
jgi:hypothetical protein